MKKDAEKLSFAWLMGLIIAGVLYFYTKLYK